MTDPKKAPLEESRMNGKYRLTVEDICDGERRDVCGMDKTTVTIEGAELASILAQALQSIPLARREAVVAQMIRDLWEGSGEEFEFWPGYNEAFDTMVQGACQLVDGWQEHDQHGRGKSPKLKEVCREQPE